MYCLSPLSIVNIQANVLAGTKGKAGYENLKNCSNQWSQELLTNIHANVLTIEVFNIVYQNNLLESSAMFSWYLMGSEAWLENCMGLIALKSFPKL